MVLVRFKIDGQNRYTGFACSGHAEFAEVGLDIVCASISVLVMTIANSLEAIVRLPLQMKADETSGYFECSWTNQPDKWEQSELLVKTLIFGLCEIREQYPDHISICEVEV